jgi:hypothetical protein
MRVSSAILLASAAACGDGGSSAPPDAAPDAPPIDAPSVDAPDATACDDAFAGALFCDGFESGMLDRWTAQETNLGTVATAADGPYRGGFRLDARVTSPGGRGFTQRTLAPIASGSLYARLYVHIDVPAVDADHGATILSLDAGSINERVGLATTGGEITNELLLDSTGILPTVMPPVAPWNCVQLAIVIDDVAGSVALDINGTRMVSLDGVDTLPATGFTRLAVGVSSLAEFGVEVDELVVATTPIPCDP